MKEVIAKRDIRLSILILVVCVIGLVNGILWDVKDYQWMQFILIGINVIGILFAGFMLFVVPRNVIEKRDEQLILNLWVGTKNRVVVDIANIKEVDNLLDPQKPNKYMKGAVGIKAVVDGKEQIYECLDLVKAPLVLEKLKALIGKE